MFAIVVGGTNVSKTFTQNPENTKRRPGTAECTFASSLPTALDLDLGSQLGALGLAVVVVAVAEAGVVVATCSCNLFAVCCCCCCCCCWGCKIVFA